MLNWSEWEEEQASYKRMTILPLLTWLGIIACVIWLLAGLSGCASSDDLRVCLMKVMGQTEDGMAVVAQQCMTPEAFAETQK